jgi:hypothetical protein
MITSDAAFKALQTEARVAGLGEVLTPVSKLQASFNGLNSVLALSRPMMIDSLIGRTGAERSILLTAAGALTAVSKDSKLLASTTGASSALATLAGVNARIDLVQNLSTVVTGVSPIGAISAAKMAASLQSTINVDLLGDAWQASLTQFVSGFAPQLDGYMGILGRLREQREKTAEGSTRFVERHGWPIPLALPPSAIEPLVALTDKPRRLVRQAMVNTFAWRTHAFLYTREVLLESESFESRKRPIEQALRAMRREDYYAAICTMLPLIEGALVDAVFTPVTTPRKGVVKSALSELADPGSLEEDWAVQMIEAVLISGAGGVALFETFERGAYGVPGESRRLNRHAILHGSARKYGSRENSLKLFLLLAALADTLDLAAR